MNRIYLVGFMGAGKTAVGEALAKLLGTSFVDLDERLCRRFGAAIGEVFARHGEAAFRAAESAELAAAAAGDGAVVATGGGAYCRAENRRLIEDAGGVAVYLHLPWEVLRARLEHDHAGRPKYGDEASARRLWEERLPLYRRATVIVELAGDESPDEVARRVAAALEEAPCAP
ncbi:MAG: shikimate kinase [Thermoanaerobaculales bacterium]|jgi:shikimate kinase|nr:shikimate kinase [Thermoanaerobaculales bacterium]